MWPFDPPVPDLERPSAAATASDPQSTKGFTVSLEDESDYISPQYPSRYQSPYATGPYKDLQWGKMHYRGWENERLAMSPLLRAMFLMTASFFVGGAFGANYYGRKHADRYRAENAHRFPSTKAGWYLYQKTKSYHMVVGLFKGFAYQGSIMAFSAGLFALIEEGVDQMRGRVFARRARGEEVRLGQRDFLSTTTAALAMAGLYSTAMSMNHFDRYRMAKVGLKAGVGVGILQDVLQTVRGQPPAYLSWCWRKVTLQPAPEIRHDDTDIRPI